MSPNIPSLSNSEESMSSGDEGLASKTAQLSISKDPSSKTPPPVPPPQSSDTSNLAQHRLVALDCDTSHACTFDIQSNALKYRGKFLTEVEYRPRDKRALNTDSKISFVYQYGADIKAKDFDKLWLCKKCYQQQTSTSQIFDAKSTSSIKSHLKKIHGIMENKVSSEGNPSQIGLIQRGLLPPPFDDLRYKKDLVDTFLDCDLSFALLEKEKFRKLLISGRLEIEAVLPSSHTTIKDWMLDAFQSRKAQIKDQMSLANSKINISLDGWRSPNRDDYIAICAHFINEDFKIVHCLLGFRDVKGVKSGQGTAEITAKVINDYEIGDNLGGFMMDNAGDNDTALQALAEEFDLDVDFSRLRCLGHIINLVVKALLFGKGVSKVERELAGATGEAAFRIWNKQGPIGRLHNICVYVNTNSTRHTAFKDCQGEEIQVYKLLTDGGIRWNSTEAMISRGMFPDVHLQYLCYWLIWLLNISHQTPCSHHPLPTSVETSEPEGCLRSSARLPDGG
jgi:hypothetical protein